MSHQTRVLIVILFGFGVVLLQPGVSTRIRYRTASVSTPVPATPAWWAKAPAAALAPVWPTGVTSRSTAARSDGVHGEHGTDRRSRVHRHPGVRRQHLGTIRKAACIGSEAACAGNRGAVGELACIRPLRLHHQRGEIGKLSCRGGLRAPPRRPGRDELVQRRLRVRHLPERPGRDRQERLQRRPGLPQQHERDREQHVQRAADGRRGGVRDPVAASAVFSTAVAGERRMFGVTTHRARPPGSYQPEVSMPRSFRLASVTLGAALVALSLLSSAASAAPPASVPASGPRNRRSSRWSTGRRPSRSARSARRRAATATAPRPPPWPSSRPWPSPTRTCSPCAAAAHRRAGARPEGWS